jgi:hypothetical protein
LGTPSRYLNICSRYNSISGHETITFLSANQFIELAFQTGIDLAGVIALHLISTQGTRDTPTRPAGIFTVVDSVQASFGRCRTGSDCFEDVIINRLSAACLVFPTVRFLHSPWCLWSGSYLNPTVISCDKPAN